MNIEKIKEFVKLSDELRAEGVIGFSFHGSEVHARKSELFDKENLQIEYIGSGDYPYEIFIMEGDIKIFALATLEQVKDLPQFVSQKEHIKAELLKKVAELETDKEATA